MKFGVPESDTSSTQSSRTYYSFPDLPEVHINLRSMADLDQTTYDTPMFDDPNRDLLSSLSQSEIKELLRIREERMSQSSRFQPANNISSSSAPSRQAPVRLETNLPKWNGKLEDFEFYMRRLELRVERELSPFADPCRICLDMIDTLPETKQARAAEWFNESERKGDFNWRELATFFRKQFEDKQARQTAASILNRMEQGYHQYFDDFLRDFEYRIVQSGGREAHTDLGKTQKLKDAVNSRLRRHLIGVKLPPPENYQDWVEEVREIAKDLESLEDYRPKGAIQTKTVLGTPKSGSAQVFVNSQLESQGPKLDSDGDTLMGGTNAILAAINDLKKGGWGPQQVTSKPRAPWRTKEDIKKLIEEGRCTRCTKKGHIGKFCRSHLPAQRPVTEISALDGNLENESGNEEP